MDQAREAVTRIAANAGAQAEVLLVEHYAKRRVKWVQPGRAKVGGQVLNTLLVAYSGPRICFAGRRIGWIFAAIAAHLIEVLSLRVVRFQFLITDRPRW